MAAADSETGFPTPERMMTHTCANSGLRVIPGQPVGDQVKAPNKQKPAAPEKDELTTDE